MVGQGLLYSESEVRAKPEIRAYYELRASNTSLVRVASQLGALVPRVFRLAIVRLVDQRTGASCRLTDSDIRRMSHIVPPRSERDDPLSRMQAYRFARELLKD